MSASPNPCPLASPIARAPVVELVGAVDGQGVPRAAQGADEARDGGGVRPEVHVDVLDPVSRERSTEDDRFREVEQVLQTPRG